MVKHRFPMVCFRLSRGFTVFLPLARMVFHAMREESDVRFVVRAVRVEHGGESEWGEYEADECGQPVFQWV